VSCKSFDDSTPYNEIHMWDYKALPAVFGGKNVEIHDVESSKDLQDPTCEFHYKVHTCRE
jgi:TPP-dependent 2-oxoacid decarboxylase